MKWLYLAVAIVAEIFATSALKGSEGFTRLVPSGGLLAQALLGGAVKALGRCVPSPVRRAKDLSVWYLHVDVGDMTNTYLLSSGAFTPYRLPPAGTFERRAYPFLLMDTRDGALRLGGISAELWGLVAWLQNAAN